MPAAPTALYITSQSASAVALAWAAPSGPTPTNYVVYRSTATSAGAWAQPVAIATPAALTFSDTTGAANGKYLYQVTAVTSAVESPASNGVMGAFIAAGLKVPGPDLAMLDTLFGVATFTSTVVYTALGYGPLTFQGIFNDENKDSAGKQGADINNSKPQLTCKTSDVPNLSNAALFSVAGVAYRVQSIDPDGAGMTVIWLTRNA